MEWGLPGGCAYFDLDFFNKIIYLSDLFNEGQYVNYIFLLEVGLLQLPLSPPTETQDKTKTQHPKASGVNLKLQQLGRCPSAIHQGIHRGCHGSFKRTAKARSEERTNNTKEVVCNKPHSYEWPPPKNKAPT